MMRKTLQAAVLMLALSASAYAGDMQFPITAPPPQQPASAVQGPTTDGEIPCDVTQVALDLLTVLPSLF